MKTEPHQKTLFSKLVFRMAKGLLAGAAIMAALCGPQLQAQVNQSPLPFYEPFPNTYINGEYLGTNGPGGVSGVVWDFGNGVSSSCARVSATAALQYPGLTNIDAIAQSYGLMSYPKDSSSVKCRGAALLVPATNTTLYASCLVNFQHLTNPAAAWFFGLSSSTAYASGSVANGAVLFISPQGGIQVAKNSNTPATNATYTLTISNTYLVVLRYKFNAPGTPDQVDVWIDPTSLGNDATMPAPTFTTTNNANVASLGSVAYYQSAGPTLFFLDEIRVATNWAGVTPTTPPPGQIYGVSGGGSGCAGDSFNVGVSNSDVGVTYLLYTNGVPTGSSMAGTGAAVNFTGQTTTALYTVLATNTTLGYAAWMRGSATISVLAAPNIASQPAPVLVATNALCAFSVSSIGSGLNYQWYRGGSPLNDNGHYVGSQTPTLVISSASTTDAATTANGYYVIVSNRCGSVVISTTNALTLQPAANLVWSGDGNSNFWDLATSANWNSGAAVFNYGDNVTFDDTSSNPNVNLNSTNLSPSSITINGSQAYVFGGNGTLAGGGEIVVNTTGSLMLSAPNNMTGGLVASNGIVYFSYPSDLGLGALNLAGGELYSPGSGLVTLTNTINVTGINSVLGVNSPGGQNLVLTGPLNGLGGSLILRNITTKNAASGTVEFTQNGFTFGPPVYLDNGNGTAILGGLNSSGSQIWNGLITGGGIVWRDASGGTTILNNTNMFTGITKLTAGSLGVGCDSIAISSPPNIDAGPLGTGTFTIDTGTAAMELFAYGGAHVVGNPIVFASTNGGAALTISGTNNLTLSGTIDLTSSNRVFQVNNTGLTVLSGVISDSGYSNNNLTNGLTKTGNGILYLDATNTYVGDTTNGAGTLAGSGILAGRLIVNSGATLGAGDAGATPGTLSVSNDVVLNGNGWFRLNKALAQSNDIVAVSGVLTNLGPGVITVTNVNSALPLAVGDTFYLFSEAVSNGAALTVTGGGMNWTNHLAVDGSITALSAVSTIANYPTNMTFNFNGSSLQIGWPATHQGWILQSQTNALGTGLTPASNAWHDIIITASGTNASISINPANPTVYFRLRHP
jgi:hypothetical protein